MLKTGMKSIYDFFQKRKRLLLKPEHSLHIFIYVIYAVHHQKQMLPSDTSSYLSLRWIRVVCTVHSERWRFLFLQATMLQSVHRKEIQMWRTWLIAAFILVCEFADMQILYLCWCGYKIQEEKVTKEVAYLNRNHLNLRFNSVICALCCWVTTAFA